MTRQHLNEQGKTKRSWPTFVQAQRFADALPVVLTTMRNPLEAYLCTECGSWHIGKQLNANSLLRVEIGQRAMTALAQENNRKPSQRRWYVKARARMAAERRVAA